MQYSSGTDFAYFNNTSVDTSKYIIYENTVHTNNGDYDLVIYPFKGTYRAELAITKIGKGNQKGHLYPFLHCGSGNTGGYSGYELFVCEHGNVNKKHIYTIQFDANGGFGIPSQILKYGENSSTIMGDIGSTVPTRSGYTFKGWSASSAYSSSNKRIAYSSGNTGATTTSSSWTYETYCTNTGGDLSNRILTLYAQWEPVYSHTLAYNANGGSNAPSSSIVTNSSATYNMTVSSSAPIRTGYSFAEWNINSSGTGTNVKSSGSSGLVCGRA